MDNAQCRNNLILKNILKNFYKWNLFSFVLSEMNPIELVFNT